MKYYKMHELLLLLIVQLAILLSNVESQGNLQPVEVVRTFLPLTTTGKLQSHFLTDKAHTMLQSFEVTFLSLIVLYKHF